MFTSDDFEEMFQCPDQNSMMIIENNNQKWNKSHHVEIAPNCPRCASPNTKFCYYNNYSLSQPRYFCKGCKRYWTKGGSLRNVPIGGGCRKNRRAKSVRYRPSRVFMGGSPDCDDPIQNTDETVTPPAIDLAAVFSNFLNPGIVTDVAASAPEPELSSEFDLSFDKSSSNDSTIPNQESPPINDDQFHQQNYGFECDSDPTREISQFIGGVNEVDDKISDISGLLSLRTDEVDQEFWPDASVVNDFSWQPSPLHEFEPVFDDQFTSYPNLLNW
ncbi:hypothetical protein C5167_038848 [Papaver somniferum]|uniref:Dof zinc finger protein n=1 Tax=Papaver somniferum TaxID=3469 RepID=A0A4Y7IE12_PAPSO|nr:dof zinc finger protein DOF1.2-like [Papaver somniferum]RZC45891.1 hypothetical protein C5167_038848 [Papaver somniferum]